MDRPVSEHELLSLIEGRLPPEREEALRAALADDPLLGRRIEGMMSDRALSRELSRRAELAAPAALVSAAVLAAERAALLDKAARGWPRIGSRRWTAAVTLLLIMCGAVALVAGGVYWASIPSDPDAIYKKPGGLGQVGRFGPVPDREERAGRRALENAPWLTGGAVPMPIGGDIVMSPHPDAGLTPEPARDAVASTADDPSQWGAEAEAKLAGSAVSDGGAIELGGLRVDRAVELARGGRLRVVVPVADPGAWPRGSMLLASGLARPEPGSEAVGAGGARALRYVVELVTPRDDADLALRDAVSGLFARLGALADGPVRLEEVPESAGEEGAGASIPSTEPSDVLWWAHPASKWTRAESVLIPVHLERAR